MKQSKLVEKITIDQFDFDFHSSCKKQKSLIQNLLSLDFVTQKKDTILIGNPGVGKTFLSKCIAYAATQAALKVLFTTAIDMINHLVAAEVDHSLLRKLHYYQSPDLLVIDEIGYLPLGTQGSHLFFQVVSARHERKSTMITTNLPFANWGNIFDSTTVATAIADRLVSNSLAELGQAEVLIMEGKSYRQKPKKVTTQVYFRQDLQDKQDYCSFGIFCYAKACRRAGGFSGHLLSGTKERQGFWSRTW